MPADLLIYLAVVTALWAAYVIGKRRRARGKRRFGNSDAYEGNLIIPPGGESHGAPHRLGPHGGHSGHDGGHMANQGAHLGHGDVHSGHGAVGGHH